MALKNKQISNPLRGEHVVLSFKQEGFLGFDNASINFSYIPDREIITEKIFFNWLKITQKKRTDKSPEVVANEMLNAFYNEVLPFYVTLDIVINHSSGAVQRVQTIKKQPKYKIPEELINIIAF